MFTITTIAMKIVRVLSPDLLMVVDQASVTDRTKQGFKTADSPYIVSCPTFEL